MELYFAPLEGIGGYLYRNAQADFFPTADKYFSPFLAPDLSGGLKSGEKRDIAPGHNERIRLIPQVMTNNAQAFAGVAGYLKSLGYEEINLNLGCPSRTVVTKFRGAGFLAKPEELDHFLEEVFAHVETKISVKTRLGMEQSEEFEKLLEIYDRYPLCELIIHPRVQADYYKNQPRMDAFARALAHTRHKVVYNGDLFCAERVRDFAREYPQVGTVMLGRGVLCDPCLFGEIRGTEALTKEKLREFHDRLLSDYREHLFGDRTVLCKMKELWFYMIHIFTDSRKYGKKIRKAQRMEDYREAVRSLFAERELCRNDFQG